MSGDILIKLAKEIACEEWGWVAGRVISFCNIDVTKVAEFGCSVRYKTLGLVAGYEEGRDRNKMANKTYKSLSKRIYINHNLVTSMNNSEMII